MAGELNNDIYLNFSVKTADPLQIIKLFMRQQSTVFFLASCPSQFRDALCRLNNNQLFQIDYCLSVETILKNVNKTRRHFSEHVTLNKRPNT